MSKNGGFFRVWKTEKHVFIEEMYQLYRPTHEMEAHWSTRDYKEWKQERSQHIQRSDKIKIGDAKYFVTFNCELTDNQKQKIMTGFHDGKWNKANFDD